MKSAISVKIKTHKKYKTLRIITAWLTNEISNDVQMGYVRAKEETRGGDILYELTQQKQQEKMKLKKNKGKQQKVENQ